MKGVTPFQIGLIAAFAVLALAGLFVFANFQGFGGKKDVVGTVVVWGTLPAAALQSGIEAVSSGNQEYAKVSYVEKSAASFGSDLAEALASGTGPDLVLISQEMLVSQKSKLNVIPYSTLPQRTYLDTYLPEFELFLTSDGTYGLPLALDPLVLYYNRATLASAGIVAPPSTWEAVAGLAPAITKRANGGTITRSLIALGEYSNVHNARAILSLLLLQAGSSITVTSDQGIRSTLSDDASSSFGSTPAQSAVNFYAQFADSAKTVYSWNRSLPDSRSMFVAGDLALYPGFASELSFIQAANPNLDFDLASIPSPGVASSRLTYGLAYAFAVPKASGNAAGAYLVASALSGVGPSIAANLGMAPAARRSLEAADDDRYGSVYYPEALLAKGWLSPAPALTDAAFSAMMSDIITGRKSVIQALTIAAQALTAALH